tara:strand:+ start:6340 stop:7662 length:1323 start_codon:yes stop_codon:yes gene_type:complete
MDLPFFVDKFRAKTARIFGSSFGQNVAWVTGLSGVERFAALLQTIIVARALGITEYGVYGLLFGTIGFTASITGMQMGLTATVFIARYKGVNKAKARRVVQHVNRFALVVSAVFFFFSLPFSNYISVWLLSSDQYVLAVILGCIFVGGSLVSGVQDGVVQGFEDFKAIARVKIFTSLGTLVVMYPGAKMFGLEGVLLVLLGALFLKYLLLNFVARKYQLVHGFPRQGSGVKFSELVLGFSAPSMMTSLLVGFATWFGMYLLSKQAAGFDEVAIVNTGVQWRGPLLLISSSIGSVAIPVFSRLNSTGNSSLAHNLQSNLLWLNGVAALVVVSLIAILAEPLLGLYGESFIGGKYIFLLILAASIPQVIAQVYMQKLVGDGKIWLQFWLHVPFFCCLLAGFILLIPAHSGLGYAGTMLASTLIFLLYSVVTLKFYEANDSEN